MCPPCPALISLGTTLHFALATSARSCSPLNPQLPKPAARARQAWPKREMDAKHIPETMLAVQVTEYNKPYQLQEVAVPSKLGPHDLLVKIAAASYCHTDGMVRAGKFGTRLPCIASHEGSGTVVAVGSAVSNFQPGDRVMCGVPFQPCGTCSDCTGPETWQQYCTNTAGHCGVHIDGFFAQYARADERTTTSLPGNLSLLEAAPLACAGRTVFRGVEQAALEPGQWLAIVGSGGGLGHLGIQFAKGRGLRVVGIDARDEGLDLSRQCGADVVLDARGGQDAVLEQVRRATGGQGADATLNLSDAPSAAALACAVTRMHGTMVQIAQPQEVAVPFPELVFRDVRIKGSVICSPEESKRMVHFAADNQITVAKVPFQGLAAIHDLVEKVDAGTLKGKAVIVIDQEQINRE